MVLEAQEWQSYQSKKHLTPHAKQTRNALKFLPTDFTAFLVNVVGFLDPEEITNATPVDCAQSLSELRRKLQLFRKPLPVVGPLGSVTPMVGSPIAGVLTPHIV